MAIALGAGTAGLVMVERLRVRDLATGAAHQRRHRVFNWPAWSKTFTAAQRGGFW